MIKEIFILFCMMFLHIVDDFYLQGILAKLKQKAFWKEVETTKSKLYKYDYLIALGIHSFSWTFMVMLIPAILISFNITWIWLLLFISNFIIHFIVDDLKANKYKINLVVDQSIHILQIIIIWIVLIII